MTLQQEDERGEIVEEESRPEGGKEPAGGKVLDEQKMVVAEIEKGLEGVVLGQGAAAHVIHHRAGFHHDAVAGIADAPAEVNLLHVGEKVGVEAAKLAVHIAAHKQRRTGGPENVHRRVVLTVVGLHCVEHTSATEGIAVFVDETAGSAGILEFFAVGITAELGLHSGDLRVGIHHLHDRLYPAVGHLNVGIEQTEIFGLNLLQSDIIAARKAIIAVVQNQPHLRIVGLHESDRVIRGGIVSHYNFRIIRGMRKQ